MHMTPSNDTLTRLKILIFISADKAVAAGIELMFFKTLILKVLKIVAALYLSCR